MPADNRIRKNAPTLNALNKAIRAARHRLTDEDAPVIEAARTLALKIDMADEYFEELTRVARELRRPPPSVDGNSHGTFLNYCRELGFGPAVREKSEAAKAKNSNPTSGKLSRLRSVPKPDVG